MLERENTVDVSFDSGISLVDRPPDDDVKKEILEYKRILFILDRDRDKHAQTRNRLSQISDRKPKQKKTDVCNVCCETIDLEDFKCCVTCCNCGKDVCRGRQCSTWLPRQAEWECHLCNLSNESRSRTNEWIHRQVLPNLNPRPMSMRSDTTIPVRGNNGSHLPYNYETHSEAASFCPEEKERVRGYVEDILAGMLGGSLDDVSVGQLYRSREYLPLSGSENNYGGVSHVKLKRLIERIIEDTLHLPALIDYSGVPGRQEESLPYFDPKRYQELLATAVLNKIVDSYNYEKKFSSNPEIQTSADLDNNHNAVITRKDQRSYSSSSSIEPRSDSSLADAININRRQDVSPSESCSNLLSEAIKQNPHQEDESLMSDYIAKHRVPLPDFTLEFERDSVSDDLVSIATSHGGGQEGSWENNWLFKRKKPGSDNPAPIGMLVPAPKEDVRALIGDRTTDEVSDLSEAGSDLEDDLNGVNSDESQNGRVQNKHLIGGKSTVGIFDELLEQTSLVSTSSLPENEPAYTETKNDFVLGNDGLHDVQSLKLNLISGNITVQNEAVNSELTTQILEVHQPSKHAQSDLPGNSFEDTLILPPPPCFIDSEEGACKLEGTIDENLNGGPLSNDSNTAQSQLTNELNSATNNTNTEIADTKKVSQNETNGSTINNENKSFLRESRETLVTRRASAIEFLAVFALSPVLAFSTGEIDNRIIMKPAVRNIIEESDNGDENENLITYSIGAEPSIHTEEVVSKVCTEETVSETCTSMDSDSVVEELKDSEQISEQGSVAEIKESKIEEAECNFSDSLKLEEKIPKLKEEIVTPVQAESTEKMAVKESLEDKTQNLEEVSNTCENHESQDTQKDNKSLDINAPQEPEVEPEIPNSNFENVTELVKSCTESANNSEDNAIAPNESCDVNQNEEATESQVSVVAEELELLENIETVVLKKEEISEETPSSEESTRTVPTELPLESAPVAVISSKLSNTDVETMPEDTENLDILVKKEESQKLQEKTFEISTNMSPIVAEASVECGESDTSADKSEVEQVPETTEIISLPQDPIVSQEVEVTSVDSHQINLKENTELTEVHQTTENPLPIEESLETDKTGAEVESKALKISADLLPTKAPQISETAVQPAASITQVLDETVQIKPLEELKQKEESPISMEAAALQIDLNMVVETPEVPKEVGDSTINLTEEQLSKKAEPTSECSGIDASDVIDTVLESQQSQSEPEISKTSEESLTSTELVVKENLIISGNEENTEMSKENEASSINQTERNAPIKDEELSSDLNIEKNSPEPHISNTTTIEEANISSTENTQPDPVEYEEKTCESIEKSESRENSLENSEDVISSTELEVAPLINKYISTKENEVENSPDTFVETPSEASQVEKYKEQSTVSKDESKTDEKNSQNIIVDENDQTSAHSEENKELNSEEPTFSSAIIIVEPALEHDSSIDVINSGEINKLSANKESEEAILCETSLTIEARIAIEETSTVEEEFISSAEIEKSTEDKDSIPIAREEIDSVQLKEEPENHADKVQALSAEVKELTSELVTAEHKIEDNVTHPETTALDTGMSCSRNETSAPTKTEEGEIFKSEPKRTEERTAEHTVTLSLAEVTTESISPASPNFSVIIDSVKTVDIRKYSISEQDVKSDVLSGLPKKELAANIENISEAVADDEKRGVNEITKLVEVTEELVDAELESKDAKCKEDTSKLAESSEQASEMSESSKLEEAVNEKSSIEETTDSQYNKNITAPEENKLTEIDACSSLQGQTAQLEQKEVGSHIEDVTQTKDLQSEPINNEQTSSEESATENEKCSEENLIDDASLPENETKSPDLIAINNQDVENQKKDTATSQKIIEEILVTNIDSNSVQENLPNAALPSVDEPAPAPAPIVAQCEETVDIATEEPTITEKQNLQTLQSKDVILTPPLDFQCDIKESLVPAGINLVGNKVSTSNDEPITDQNAEDLNSETNDNNLKIEEIAETRNPKIEDSSENEDQVIKIEANKEEQIEDTVSVSEKQVDLLSSNVIFTEFQQDEQCQSQEDFNIKEEELPASECVASSDVSIENNKNNENSVSEIKESETTSDMNIANPSSSDKSSVTNIIDESNLVATETDTLDEFSVEVKEEEAAANLETENIVLKETVNEVDGKDSQISKIIHDSSLNDSEQANKIESQEVLQEAEDTKCALDQNVEVVTTTNSDASPPTNKECSVSNIDNNSSLSATAVNTVGEDLKSSSEISTSSSKIASITITEEAVSLLVETNSSPLSIEDTTQIDEDTSAALIEESCMDNDTILKTEPEDVLIPADADTSSMVQNDDTISKETEIIEACLNIESSVSASRQGDEKTESSIISPDEEIQPASDETILKEIKVVEDENNIMQSTLEVPEIPTEKSLENTVESTHEDSLNSILEESSLVPSEQESRENKAAATSELQKTLKLEENLKNEDNTLKEETTANELENSAVESSERNTCNIIEAETNPKIKAPNVERCNTDSSKINKGEEKVEKQEDQADKLLTKETPVVAVKSSLTEEQENNSSTLSEVSNEVSITVQEPELNKPPKEEEELISKELSEGNVKESALLESTETILITSCENFQSLSEEQKRETIEETIETSKQSATTVTDCENVGTQLRIEEQEVEAVEESTKTIEERTETIEEPGTTVTNSENVGTQPKSEEQKRETIEETIETSKQSAATATYCENVGTQPQIEEQKSEVIEESIEEPGKTITNFENVGDQPQSEEQKSEIIEETTEMSKDSSTTITNYENVGTLPQTEEQKTEAIEETAEIVEEPSETIEDPGRTISNFENIGTQSQSEEQKSKATEEPIETPVTTIFENAGTQPQKEEQKCETIEEATETIKESAKINQGSRETIEAAKEEIEDAKEIYVDAKETFDDTKETIEETKELFEDAKETIEEIAETFEDAKETIEEHEEIIKELMNEQIITQNNSSTKNDDTNLDTVTEMEEKTMETNATVFCPTVEDTPSLTSSLSYTVESIENKIPAQTINMPTVLDDVKTLSSVETDEAINPKQVKPLADESNSSTVINEESVSADVIEITKQITLEVENEDAKLEQTVSIIECEISEPAEELKVRDEDLKASSLPDKKDYEESLVESITEGCETGSQPNVIEKSLKEEINEVITLSTSDNLHQTVEISNIITDTTAVITEIVEVPSIEDPALLDEAQNYDAAKDSQNQTKDSTDLNDSTNEEEAINDDTDKAVPKIAIAEVIVKENSEENVIEEVTSEEPQIAITSIEDEAKENSGSVEKLTSSDTERNQTTSTTEYDVKSAFIDSVPKEEAPQTILNIEESPDCDVFKKQIPNNKIEAIDEKQPDKLESDDSSAEKVEILNPVPEELHTPEQLTNTKEERSYNNENTQSKVALGENIDTQYENASSSLENIEAKTEEDLLKADSLIFDQNTAVNTPQNTASENQKEEQDVDQDAKVGLDEATKIDAIQEAADQVSSKQTDEENKSIPITEVIEKATENIVTQQAEAGTEKNVNYANNIEEAESNEDKCDLKSEEAIVVANSEQETEETSDRANDIETCEGIPQDPDNITTKLEEEIENPSTESGKEETTSNMKLEDNSASPIETIESEMPEEISSKELVIDELQPTAENIETTTPLKEDTDETKTEEEITEHIKSAAETTNKNILIEKNNEESTICTNIAAIKHDSSVDSCEEAIVETVEASEKEEIKIELHCEAIHFTGNSKSIIQESDITSAPKETSKDLIEEAFINENLSAIEAKISEDSIMVEIHVPQSQPTNASEAEIQQEIEVEVSAVIDTRNSSETSFNAHDVVIAKSESIEKNNLTHKETTEIISDSNSKTIEEPPIKTNGNLTKIETENLDQLSSDALEDSKENETVTVKESNITNVTEVNEAPSNEVILEESSSEEANSILDKNTDEVAEDISNLELKISSPKEEISLLSDTLAKGANSEYNASLKQEIVKPTTIQQTSEEKLVPDCIQTASEALDLIKVSIHNSNEITSEEMNLVHQENAIILTSTKSRHENREPLTDSSISIQVSINSSETENLEEKEQEIVSVYVEYKDETTSDDSSTSENIPIQETNSSLPLPTLTEEIEPPEEIENAETSFRIILNSDRNATTIHNRESTEISSSSNKTPSEILSDIPKLTSPELLGKNNKIENNTSSEKQNKENVTNEKCPSSTLQFSVSTVSLKSHVISTEIVSSDSNTTDESVLTVIDARGLQQKVDEPNETAEIIVNITSDTTNNTTNNKTLTTTTTTNNNTNTTLDITLSTNSVDTNTSNETGLEKSSEPESTENTSISKPLSEEHDVADPLKHLVPGSIAEREYKKWYNAVEMPNNPYTPEAIQRRLSLTEKSIDIPNIKPVMERMRSGDDNTEDIATTLETKSDYTRYSRDYYINDAKHASGMVKSKTKSTSQSLLNTDDEQGISKQEPLSEGITTTCIVKSQSATDKQSDNADIFLARPIRVEENDPLLDKATKFEQLNTPERDIILLPSGELDSLRNTSTPVSEQGSSLTAESLTTSEDSDTIRIYDLNSQETRLVKDETNAVKSPPNTPNRPTVLSFMPKASPPTKVLTPTRIVTPTSLRFLQPKRKIFDPKQIMTESFEKSSPIPDGDDHEEPATNGIADKPVIEKEVASSLPSVRALAQAFLLASSKRNSNPLNRPKSPSLQTLEVKIDAEATNECSTEDGPSADSYAPPYNQIFNPVAAPAGEEAPEDVVEERKIVYSVETPAAERPISPVLTPGQLRNSIAFFENLKKQ